MAERDLIVEYGRATYDYDAISADRRRQQPSVLRAFAAHIEKDLTAAEGRDLHDYLATRLSEGLAPTTLGKHLAMIRPFYAWLYREKLIDAAQLLDLREVKPPRGSAAGQPRPYNDKELGRFWRDMQKGYPWTSSGGTREEAERYLERWRRGSSHFRRVRFYARRLQIEAVIALALYGGLRLDEIYRLEVEDMHYDNSYVLVRGARKNKAGESKLRTVPWVCPQMRNAVHEWLLMRDEIGDRLGLEHDRPWLTLSRFEAHYTNAMPKRVFEMVMTDLGWTFHRLRHTAATEMLRAGYELEKVQKIMGHGSITMTLRYAAILTDDILNTAARGEKRLAARMERLRSGGNA